MNTAWRASLLLKTEHEFTFMAFNSSFHTHLATLTKVNSPTSQEIGFICMFLHEAIQDKILKPLCDKFLTNLQRIPLVILERMEREITTSNVSDKILHEQSESLNDKQILRQLKAKISQSKSVFFPRNTGNLIPTNIYSQVSS